MQTKFSRPPRTGDRKILKRGSGPVNREDEFQRVHTVLFLYFDRVHSCRRVIQYLPRGESITGKKKKKKRKKLRVPGFYSTIQRLAFVRAE